jgi:hypothetical protein
LGAAHFNPSLLSALIQVLRLNKHFEQRVLLKYKKERTFCSANPYTSAFENEMQVSCRHRFRIALSPWHFFIALVLCTIATASRKRKN